MESSDAELLAAGSDVLSCQHSGIWGRLVTIGLDLHATSDTGDGFATTVSDKSASISCTGAVSFCLAKPANPAVI